MTREEHEIARCEREMRDCENPDDKLMILLGWADWNIEHQLLQGGLMAEMREFATGATRNVDNNKPDFEGFFSPLVLERRAQYMHKNRHQADGKLRDSDNWQKGIPFNAYMKSAFRHFFEWWKTHRDHSPAVELDTTEEAICALMFNCEGYLHELLKVRQGARTELTGL